MMNTTHNISSVSNMFFGFSSDEFLGIIIESEQEEECLSKGHIMYIFFLKTTYAFDCSVTKECVRISTQKLGCTVKLYRYVFAHR